MDNNYIYKEKDESLNTKFENQLIDGYLQENEQMQAGYDMEKKHVNSVDQMLNLNKTEEDVANISRILDNMKLGTYVIEEQDVKQAKLEAIQGRMLSHLMLNDQKLTGDSDEMEEVKNKLADLEIAMTAEQRSALDDKKIDTLQALYESAINACRKYCDKKNPWLPTGKRRKAKVKATLERLIRESDSLELGRMLVNKDASEAKTIKSGIQLLSLTAVQALTEEMNERNAQQKLKEDIEKIEDLKSDVDIKRDAYLPIVDQNKALFEMKKAEYDQMKADYDKLYKHKEEVEKIGWFKLKFGGDEQLDSAYEKLKAKELERDNAESDYIKIQNKIKELDDKNESYDKNIVELETNRKKEKESKRQKKEADRASAGKVQEENVKQLENKINELPEDLQELARMISNGTMPTSVIKNKKKIKSSEKKALSDLLVVRKALNGFSVGKAHSKTIRIADKYVRLLQDEFGNAQIQYGKVRVPIAFNAAYTVSMIATDVMHNRKIYGDGAVLDVLRDLKTDIPDMTRGDVIRTRDFATQILSEVLAVPKTLLNNFSSAELRQYAVTAFEKKNDKAVIDDMKKDFLKIANHKNNIQKERNINTVLNQELQNAGVNDTKNIELNLGEKEEKSNWDKREQKVRDLVADLIYSSDTWVADGLIKDPAERIRQVLLKNAEAIALIVADQFRDKNEKPNGLIEDMVAKLPILYDNKEEEEAFRNELAENLNKIRKFVSDMVNSLGGGLGGDVAKAAAEKSLKYSVTGPIVVMIKERLNDLTEEQKKDLAEIDKQLDEKVEGTMSSVQNAFSSFINVIFEDDEDELVEEEKKEEKKEENKEEKKEENKDNKDEDNDDFLNENVDDIIKAEKKEVPKEDDLMQDLGPILDGKNMDPEVLRVRKEQMEEMKRFREKEKADNEKKERRKLEDARKNYDKKRIRKSKKRVRDLSEKVQQLENAVAVRSKAITEMIVSDMEKFTEEEQQKIQAQLNEEEEKNAALKETITSIKARIAKHKKFIEATEKKYRMKDLQNKIDDRVSKIKDIEDSLKVDKANLNRLINKRKKGELTDDEEDRMEELMNIVGAEKHQLEKAVEKSGDELDKILKDNLKGGKAGQSLFMKNVFKIYFKSMGKLDKRSMVASAIKNSQAGPKLTYEERKNLTDDQQLNLMSSMLGGMFKGAGPLFQKMLQGLPIDSLPKGLRKAVEDTQDSLASIPDEVVKAHMDSIKVRSAGKITKIDVNKSLGAASVGQAFLCRVYGPELPAEGKNVVIKLLRPDVRNRMMREKKVMLEAAKMTDENGMLPYEVIEKRNKKIMGGMEATYLGNLQRIEEELDLTIEANNCKEGQVYDNPIYDKDEKEYKENVSNSMKLSDLADPTSDTCVMEIAGTKTVKRFMSDVDKRISELLWDYCEKEEEVDKQGNKTGNIVLKREKDGTFVFKTLSYEQKSKLAPIIDEVQSLLEQHEKTQQGIAQVVEKWVTEGIFQKGYYHGDLHAGNIMISENGVTVIDFGNATKLSSEQQKHIIKMMVAATMGDVERFRHGFHMLLENTPEEVYQEKRDELTLVFKDVMTMGDESSVAERIAVALVRAQELGIELPPTIANFSSCQMRLQNTLGDVNKSLKKTRAQFKKIRDAFGFSQKQRDHDPVAKHRQYATGLSAEKKKEDIKNVLMNMGVSDEQEFRSALRDKSKRSEFMKKYGMDNDAKNKMFEEDIKKIDDLFSGKTKPDPKLIEKSKNDTVDADDVFPGLLKIKNEQSDPNRQEFYNKISGDTVKFFYSDFVDAMEDTYGGIPKSFDELVAGLKNIYKNYADYKVFYDVSETEKKMIAFHKAQDNKNTPPEELERLENEVWESFRKDKLAKSTAKAEYFEKCRKNLLPKIDDVENATPEQHLKWHRENGIGPIRSIVESCVNNKKNGEELKKVSEEVIALHKEACKSVEDYEKNKDALNAKFDEMLSVLWEAQINTLTELYEGAKDDMTIKTKDPENFLKIMSDVMQDKKYSVLWSLDKPVTVKMIWDLTKEKIAEKFGNEGGE